MISYNKHILSNGLILLHHRDATTKMVALNLLYNVGSKDESPSRTGLAHLFEHLMFGGSANVPNYDDALQRAGGECNAWTNCDFTNFYEVLPAHNIETGFWLESDRLLQLRLDHAAVEAQKSVVIEEFKQRTLNRQYGDVAHLYLSTAYTTHPYRWPTIGIKPEHIAEASHEDIIGFFNAHYSTNNLILCVSGNIEFEHAIALTEKWFGGIEPRQIAPRNLPTEPRQVQARHLNANRKNVPMNAIYKVYHICDACNPDHPACDLLSDVLANGNSARFYRNILSKGKAFASIDAAINDHTDCGLLIITGRLRDGVSFDEGEAVIAQELQSLLNDGISQYEIDKFVNKFESKSGIENLSYLEKAMKLCRFEMLGDANKINTEINDYRRTDAVTMNRVAQEVLRADNCTTLWYGPDA